MPVFMVANYTDLEGAEGTELTDPLEKRRNGDERSFLEHEGHEDHKSVWPFDWPPEAACRDVRGRRYKPPIAQCGLYLRPRTSRLSARVARRRIERPTV